MKISKFTEKSTPALHRIESIDGMTKERYYRYHSKSGKLRFFPRFLDFHRLSMDATLEYPSHVHDRYELILIDRGPYRCQLNGKELEVAEGGALFIQPGDIHQDHLIRGQIHYVVHFRLESPLGEESVPLIFGEGQSSEKRIANGNFHKEIELLQQIAHESTASSWLAGRIQDALLNTLFWKIFRHFNIRDLNPTFRSLINREELLEIFDRMVHESSDRPIRVSEIAEKLGLPERSLCHQTRELTGHPPVFWIRYFRIERAKRLLGQGSMRIKEISFALGFSNPFHFSQVFKSLTGLSPKEWKKKFGQSPTRC